MKNKSTHVKFKHSLAAAAVSACLIASTVSFAASNTSGSIFGRAEAGTEITYLNKGTGVSRTITVPAGGRFNISSVPAGTYVVMDSAGNEQEVQVTIGRGSNVSFDTIEVVEVIGSRIKAIDTSSVESTEVFTADTVQRLPLPRDSVAVALLTPGAIQGGANFDRNLPSFGGASIGENGYYIDGMDVTNLRTLLSFANLPQDAIEQTQIKSGGYGVEYGRALGGIINVVTKSGSNDWAFGGSLYSVHDALRSSEKNTINRKLDGSSEILTYNSADTESRLEYNIYASGPLIENKLFFFVNLEGQDDDIDNYSRNDSYNIKTDTPNYLAKLDWYITDEHLLRFTHINNQTEYDRTEYHNLNGEEWAGKHGEQTNSYTYQEGGDMSILSYTGHLSDNLTLNLMAGKLKHQYLKVPSLEGGDCAYAWDTTNGVGWPGRKAIGCWNAPTQDEVTDDIDDIDKRDSYRADIDWVLGDHRLRFGYNAESYDSTSPGSSYSGGIYYRYQTAHENNDCTINGVLLDCGTETVRIRTNEIVSATFSVENTAWYIEDSWQLSDNILVYGGLRGETFTNNDGQGRTFLESDHLIAPRFGFSWDIDGDSSKKFYGTLGRYYIPVASNTNIRATREEHFRENHYIVTGGWNADGSPVSLGQEFGRSVVDDQIANPAVIADANLEPMYQDELILGYEQRVTDDWTLGAKFMGRTVGSGMDDFCGKDGFVRWADDNGYDNFDPHSLAGCIIINPGEDITIAMDLNNDGTLTNVTTPASYHGLPEYKRHYLGLQLTAEKALSDNWLLNLSYVLSRTFGNVEGYVNSSLAQEDPGATQDFDHANFMHGAYGNLPTDRTHQFKAFGIYDFTEELSVSMNLSLISGIPLSCQGFVSTEGMLEGDGTTAYDLGNFNRYSASSFYCNDGSGNQVLTKRGDEGRSNWLYTADLGIAYAPAWYEGLVLKATVYNLFDWQRPDAYDQEKDLDRGNPAVNHNFLKATSFQPPRYVQLTARYSF
ncbi:TonB-dependent receptor [Microbulbifer sp. 2205BS26-8]|uniref:TonB-dependent receptor n=1 Tax=Microbulbifer sp. 2205BS26-8 TaxID=3064386 RepID=UPI00273F7422|nr:TonB-dependent receptor [Microbulbifer sp. 2205BS26-8]MDP5208302.1 TonB-dependent receptor [Microbulbifer sp. 2205BS26-8]